jgi:hypothetical protein
VNRPRRLDDVADETFWGNLRRIGLDKSNNGRPGILALDRPIVPLETIDRGAGVETDDEPVADCLRLASK